MNERVLQSFTRNQESQKILIFFVSLSQSSVTMVSLKPQIAEDVEQPILNTTIDGEKWDANEKSAKVGRDSQCVTTGATTASPSKRTTHQLKSHPTNFSCELCGKGLSSKYSLTTHIKSVHHQEKPFFCYKCPI